MACYSVNPYHSDSPSLISTHINPETTTRSAIRASLRRNGLMKTAQITKEYDIGMKEIILIGITGCIEGLIDFGREYVAKLKD